MQLILSTFLSALLVSGISCDAEPLTTSLYKDAGHHDYLQSLHHGGHHSVGGSSESGSGGVGIGHQIGGLSPQIQDQSAIVPQDQVAHASAGQIGQVGGQLVGPISPYIGQKSEFPLHLGARAIGSPVPYYYGKYASPYYSQYQPGVHHGGYYQQAYPYQYSASPYSSVPYSASPYSAGPYPSVTPYSATPYYNPVSAYSGYQGLGGYPGYSGYVPVQQYPGYSSYYQQPSAELQQSVSKQ